MGKIWVSVSWKKFEGFSVWLLSYCLWIKKTNHWLRINKDIIGSEVWKSEKWFNKIAMSSRDWRRLLGRRKGEKSNWVKGAEECGMLVRVGFWH